MSRKISMSQAINEAMAMAMRKDENVILMGEDVAGGAEVDHLQDDEAWGGVLGVTKGTYSKKENGKIPITVEDFSVISSKLGISHNNINIFFTLNVS